MRLNGRTSMPRHARASGMEDRARKNLVHPGKVREGGKEDLRESAGVFVVKEMENWRGETTHQNPHQNSLRLWQVSFGRETRDLVVPWPRWAGGNAHWQMFQFEMNSGHTPRELTFASLSGAVGASEAILKTGGRSGGATDKLGFPHRASLEIGGNPRAQPPSDPTSATRMLTSVCQERTIRTDSGQLTVRTGSGQRTLGTDSQRLAV